MSKVYIISKLNQEYNDEIYSTSNGGTPKNAHSLKENAIRECEKLDINEFRGLILCEYCYDLKEIFDGLDRFDVINEINKIFGTSYNSESYDILVPKTATDDQILRLMEICTLRFFKVDVVDFSK